MIEIRPLHTDEIPQAKEFLPEGMPEPHWPNCWAVFWKGKLEHVFALEKRQIVEPFYGSGHKLSAFAAMTWIDGLLRTQGLPGYEFFVADSNSTFQDFIEKNLPVDAGREKPGKYFFRRFEV